jgi:ATP-dependent exoDNAse (exonuclease V) beta subunit
VLVLLPPDPAFVAVWIDVFESLDLPVRATTFRPMARDPFVQWVVDLAHLAGWSDSVRMPRPLLQRVLLGRFWSAGAAGESLGLDGTSRISRTLLAELLRSLRRPTVNLGEWRKHVLAFGSEEERREQDPQARQAVVRFSDALATILDPADLAASLRRALSPGKVAGRLDLGVRNALRALHGKEEAAEDEWQLTEPGILLERVRVAVAGLAGPQGEGQDNQAGQLASLVENLEGQFLSERRDPVHGVTFLPYPHYDHRKASLLIMGGLGEGQFPSTAGLPSDQEVVWLRFFGLLDQQDGAPAWVVHDVEEQINTARAALLQADEAVLSFSTEGPGTEEVHPGSLLSLLAGGWKEQDWGAEGGRAFVLPAGMDIPKHAGQAAGWRDARLFAGDASTRAGLITAAEIDDVAVERARELDTLEQALTTSRRADAERRPAAPSQAGPYAGRLPGLTSLPVEKGTSPPVYSPTSLEQFAQCPYAYFLGRVLRLKAVEDAGDELDALETGTTIHTAFAEAAREVIGGHEGAVWDLTYPPGLTKDETEENKDRKVKEVLSLLLPRVSGALGNLAKEQPTLCEPLLAEVGRRWGQAIRNWAEKHVQERIPARMDEAAIDASPAVAAALKNLDRAMEDSEAALEDLRQAVYASQPKAPTGGVGAWKRRLSTATGETQKVLDPLLKDCFERIKNGEEAKDVLDSFCRDRVESAEAIAMARVTAARQSERDRQRAFGAARKVAFAELSFGRAKDPESDPHSLPEPWEAECPDARKVLVTGQVDRIDWDEERRALAVRDYKSGKRKSVKRLLPEMREGLHLQLLLYACAVEDVLVHGGRIPWLADHKVRDVALEFPKEAGAARTDFSDEVPISGASAAGEGDEQDGTAATSTSWREIGLSWLGCLTSAIEEGRFDLIPQRCPAVSSNAYCDFERICRFSPEHAEKFEHSEARPSFPAPEEKTQKPKASEAPAVIAPSLAAGVSDPARDREVHKRGQVMAADLEHDVIVSAGAGTGKTWNLVRRYLGALDAGVAPEEILCVTFTRKAAAEMRQRVRAGLLERAAKAGSGSLPAELRAKILTLSAAPIWTLDSLALHLLQVLHDARGDGAGRGASPAVDPAGASAELEQFLSDRFLQALTEDDEDVRYLLEHVSVGCLRNEIKSVVGSACGVPRGAWPASPEEVLAGWESLLLPLVEKVRARVGRLDLTEWESCLEAEAAALPAENVEKMRAGIEAARVISSGGELKTPELLRALAAVQAVPSAKTASSPNYIGAGRLHEWVTSNAVPRLVQEALGTGGDAPAAFKDLTKRVEQLPVLAEVAFRILDLCRGWSEEFEDRLQRRGTLRYGDVEAAALHALTEDEEAAALLKQHLPFKHIFVDESQDTSERQARLVGRLAELTGSRLFWVGDPKQSIYRFRGAEVDVFEERVKAAGEVASLRVNHRSHPRLIEAINRLFGAMFEARNGDEHLDPGAKVQFEPQTWPESHKVDGEDGHRKDEPWLIEDEEPRIEWIVEGTAVEEAVETDTSEGEEEDQDVEPDKAEDEEAPPADAAVASVAVRVRQLLDEFTTAGKEPPSGHIALLVRTWNQAKGWRDALARSGVACAVQGGSGLLDTPEADLLRLWLEAAVLSDEVALAGALRGPGISLSDAGLYCLRMGYGVTPQDFKGETLQWKPPFRLSRAALWPFDPAAAVAAWENASGVGDRPSTEALLRQDAEALERFRRAWDGFGRRIQVGSTADAFEWLVEQLGLDAYWCSAAGCNGRQAVANLSAVVDVVREFESSHGSSPFRLLRYLDDMAGADDPATGGLDAGIGTPVVVTTAWQAKGREWPVVILPDLSGFKLRSDSAGMGLRRIVKFDLDTGSRCSVLHVAELVATTTKEPFKASDKPVSRLLDVYRAPAERAELRRLLYVAMTRAKERLILVGGYSPKLTDKTPFFSRDGTKFVSLAAAKKWSDLLGICARLEYVPVKNEAGEDLKDEDGNPVTRPTLGDGVWRIGQDVVLRTTSEVLAMGASEPDEPTPPHFEANVVQLWRPVTSEQRRRENPSRQDAPDSVPPPTLLGGAWPASRMAPAPPFDHENDAGTAFHKLMELWGFGATGRPMEEALAAEALDATDLGAESSRPARCAWLLEMAAKIQSANSDLLAELRAAAAAGNVYHEVPLRFDRSVGARVEGTIDLLWKDDAGWHLLDYKAGSNYPHGTGDEPLRHKNLRKHYAQVSLYVEGLCKCLPGPLLDLGVWYVSAGLAVRWAPDGG